MTRKRLLKSGCMAALVLYCSLLTGCGDGTVRSFIGNSYRFVKATDLVRLQVKEMNETNPPILSTEKTLSTLRLLRTAVLGHQQAWEVFKAAWQTDPATGKRVFNLTLKGKSDMQAAAGQMSGGIEGMSNAGLPSPEQASISRQMNALQPIVQSFAKQVDNLKVSGKLDLTSVQVAVLLKVAEDAVAGDLLALAEFDRLETMACQQN